jgi:hypothetical protein
MSPGRVVARGASVDPVTHRRVTVSIRLVEERRFNPARAVVVLSGRPVVAWGADRMAAMRRRVRLAGCGDLAAASRLRLGPALDVGTTRGSPAQVTVLRVRPALPPVE